MGLFRCCPFFLMCVLLPFAYWIFFFCFCFLGPLHLFVVIAVTRWRSHYIAYYCYYIYSQYVMHPLPLYPLPHVSLSPPHVLRTGKLSPFLSAPHRFAWRLLTLIFLLHSHASLLLVHSVCLCLFVLFCCCLVSLFKIFTIVILLTLLCSYKCPPLFAIVMVR